MITESDVSDALHFLASTDEAAAKAKSYFDGVDFQSKTIKSVEFLKSEGNNAEREASAYVSWDYRQHGVKLEEASLAWELIKNQRHTAELKIECWRTLQANRRRGNI